MQDSGPDGTSPLTAKVTGMVIEIPALTQMLMACQSLDALALKSREAVQLIQQAEAAAQVRQQQSSASSH